MTPNKYTWMDQQRMAEMLVIGRNLRDLATAYDETISAELSQLAEQRERDREILNRIAHHSDRTNQEGREQ